MLDLESNAALLDEVDDGEQEHGLVRGLHAMAAGDVPMGEEFCHSDDVWHRCSVLMWQR